MRSILKKIMILVGLLGFLSTAKAFNAIESYQNQLQGTVKKNDTLQIKDEKFLNSAFDWTKIHNQTVTNIITFGLYRDGGVMPTIAFKCEADLKVEYWSQPGQTDPIIIDHVKLQINYNPIEGVSYGAAATYRFLNGYRVKITVNDITSAELGTLLPAIFRLTGQVVVERSYDFDPTKTIVPMVTIEKTPLNSVDSDPSIFAPYGVLLAWEKYTGAEEYDLEWTFIDEESNKGRALASAGTSVTTETLISLFRNNATRVTIPREYFEISLVHASQYLPIRIRPVQYSSDGFRLEGPWNYQLKQDNITGPAVIRLDSTRHRPDLNWQYSAVYAEDGMKKEIVSYFDGTLRSRQTVTVNNSDKKAVVQESLYDEFGRPLVSILPVPLKQSRLNYYQRLHGNYTYANVYGNSTDCIGTPAKLPLDSGAGRYYSPGNIFLNDATQNKYIPDANGYPFAVSLYTPDNTGRIRVQGGVGELFQPGPGLSVSKATRFYYSKPEQWELDRMFGNDVGYANHYLKNMVVDGNGQVSVSYQDASGKTIATALAGGTPDNLDSLASKPAANLETFLILQPSQFTFDPAKLKLSANTTYTAAVPDSAILVYNVDKLIKTYAENGVTICSNCYYELKIRITDNCNRVIYDTTAPKPVGSLTSNCSDVNTATGVIRVKFDQIGEYYISFELGLTDAAMTAYTEDFVSRNTNLSTQWSFVQTELLGKNFFDCFNDCKTCRTSLGTKSDFTAAVIARLSQNGVTNTAITAWSNTLYDSLYAQCQRLRVSCVSSPCEDLENTLKLDVGPGGQYALFDGDSALEKNINVLYSHWRDAFPVKDLTSQEYISEQFEMENGVTMSPYDEHFTLSMLLKYWKPGWASYFIKYHPEYCALRFCNDNSVAFQFDEKLKTVTTVTDIPSVINGAVYKSSLTWLIDKDTAFTGILAPYRTYFIQNINNYSSQFANVSTTANGLSTKNLVDFIDYLLYCSDYRGSTNTTNIATPTGNNWTNCIPVASCRIPDLEWQMYRDKYIELKQTFYQLARSTSSYCGAACPIGNTISFAIDSCPKAADFTLLLDDDNSCGVGKQRIKITYTGAVPILKNAPINLYYPSEYTINQYTSTVFTIGQSTAYVCMSDTIDLSKLRIKEIDCSPARSGTPTTPFDCSPYNTLLNFSASIVAQSSSSIVTVQYTGPTIPSGVTETYHGVVFYPTGSGKTGQQFSIGFTNGDLSKQLSIPPLNGIVATTIENDFVSCSGSPTVTPPPASGCDSAYAYKTSRIITINYGYSTVTTDTVALKATTDAAFALYISNNCEAQADYWMQQIDSCLRRYPTNYSTNVTQLRAKFLQICKLGGDINHPNGASSIPGTAPSGGYVSFKEAIKGVLGITAFDMICNPWLLDAPYPYTVKMQAANSIIQRTNIDICAKLAALKVDYNNAAGGFYQYLVNKYGTAMNLSETEFNSLLNSCNNCRYLLDQEIQLPVFMEPGAQGAITSVLYQQGITAMKQEISLDTSSTAYEGTFSTYLNHRFGFTLAYSDYKDYESKLILSPTLMLCNHPVFATVKSDTYSCLKRTIDHAALSGIVLYKEYMGEIRRQFRKDYIAYCSVVKPQLQLTAAQQLYHFTLYYYDQAGNLSRTVPPEGVHLLDASTQQQISDARGNITLPCTYNGPSINSNKDSILNRLSTALQSTNNTAMEMWLYNTSSGNNQVLATAGANKYVFNTVISGRYLYLSIYTLTPAADGSTVDFSLSKHLVADLQAVLPLKQWTHVVLQGAGLNNSNLSVYVNGIACPLTSNAPSGGGGWSLTNTPTGIIYPENLNTLKHLRLYKRLLSPAEIAANAGVTCFSLSPDYFAGFTTDSVYWARYNLPAAGSATTIGGSTTESQYLAVYPVHTLATSYAYQSLNGVTLQHTPDAGNSRFWYDKLGRLITSQNAEQLSPVNGGATNRYSYTKFDAQGRIIEVGEKSGAASPDTVPFLAPADVETFLAAGTNTQITKTYYDEPYAAVNLPQENLRKRVSAVTYQDLATGSPQQASYYTYDQIGNVKTLWQQVQDLGIKRIDYQYDLASGKVNKVRYQRGAADLFYYNYQYDAENRLTKASTGIDSVSSDGWEIENPKTDAAYRYYLHGPLARMELGNLDLVQGLDYAYTLQGWLKGVNGNYLTAATDMGRDGVVGGERAVIARDAYAYSLDYYTGDYHAIGTDQATLGLSWVAQSGDVMGRNLYNGNISRSTLALSKINTGNPVGYSYRYDQLSRLTAMRQHTLSNGVTTWSTLSVGNQFKEDIQYDGNGNIQKYVRYGSGANGKDLKMDSLRYLYPRDGSGYLSSNRLTQVLDSIVGDPYTEDISTQAANNYIYDNIGNLVTNVRDSVTNIKWTVYGKISKITKQDNSSLEYRYDPSGNRVYKGYTHGGITEKTFYVRDAQGSTLAVYGNKDGGSGLYWKEQHLYGSSRLGIWEPDVAVGNDVDSTWDKIGVKRYELVNHLGNVLATISDKPIQETDHYKAEVLSAQDYYPFGMLQPDRSYTLDNYRYGFNGKENDNEVKGRGNQQDYGMRIYDLRLGRFLSVDPLTKNYPWNSTYAYAENSPVKFIDLDGLEKFDPQAKQPTGVTYLSKATIPTGGIVDDKNFIKIGNYQLHGVTNGDGKQWWLARRNIDGGYRDDYIVGTDAVGMFSKTSGQLEWGAGWVDKAEADGGGLLGAYKSTWTPQNVLSGLMVGLGASVSFRTPTVVETESTSLKGSNNPNTKSALSLGNKVHYDILNGSEGANLPTELSQRYPNTTFEFLRRGQKGADVKVIGGTHPSQYPNSSWAPGNNFGDFKPATQPLYKFNYEIKTGKLPVNTQRLPYSPTTGQLQ